MPVSLDINARRQARHDRRMDKARAVIPTGPYCYRMTGVTPQANGLPATQVASCPYHKRRGDWPEQANGYCRLMKVGDFSKGRDRQGRLRSTMLLWDSVKECGINDEEAE